MRRYLNKEEVETYLNRGKIIEVFLGKVCDNEDVLSYLSISKESNDKIEVEIIEIFDEGSTEYLDLYSFSTVDPDMEFERKVFKDIEELTEWIEKRYGVEKAKYCNSGIIQDEYLDYLKNK
ncbi:hypothetical protein KDU71_00020 [Carboxylicivirga sediminis]|uniref:Uncharacterized protein n=1 Tax=Carboxylicivirga sediminis TaxID=2006564 RepID=A0A941F036_9BACT|nr:hypothetical protein [Carboxylicivirga sediminis]MBR8533929.1 hypothetical protein [Carboxylicivirga sediminis]